MLDELGVPSLSDHSNNSKVIVSSRDRRALSEMGVNAETSMITMEELIEDESWKLFGCHAFPYNNGNPPPNIDEGTTKLVCENCGGLPLAIKTVGRAMSGITEAKEWELAVRSLPNASCQDLQAFNDRLRWSYDALGRYDVNLQLCFLFSAAAFVEDQIISVENDVIPLWIGEGLLQRKNLQDDHDPFETGRIYVNILADRCLIEPTLRDVDGRVVRFRVHDVLRDLAIQISEREENFYCRLGRRLTALNENECSGCTRILLKDNQLSSLPESWRAPEICSLLMNRNLKIAEIPRKVMGSMVSLKVLDLTHTSLTSLPETVGCLKQLLCLVLRKVPITRLPASLTNLVSLEVLDVSRSRITELPFNIHKLRSLKYLSLNSCHDLHCLPRSRSRLTSLQYLDIGDCKSLWTIPKRRRKNVASINDLGTLIHLRYLVLQNNGEQISEGTFGSMGDMDTLRLTLTMMASLPEDMMHMSNLRRLRLECPQVVQMVSKLSAFQNLSHLKLCSCSMLQELPDLHELQSLRQLDILDCLKLKSFHEEFGQFGTFSLLEIFSLGNLDELEELPIVEEGALPSLKLFIIMKCERLKKLLENYVILNKLQKLRIYGCSMVFKNL